MTSDSGRGDMTEFQFEEIVLGRAQEARRRLMAGASKKNDPDRMRLAEVRAEIESIQDTLASAGDDPTVSVPDDDVLARYLDDALSEASRASVERALAGSGVVRRRLIELYEDVHATVADESLPQSSSVENDVELLSAKFPAREGGVRRNFFSTGSLIAAALFWVMSIFDTAAWQTPLAFAALVGVSIAAIHPASYRFLAALGSVPRRALQAGAYLAAAAAIVLGVADPVHLASACALMAAALVGLFAIRTHRPESPNAVIEEAREDSETDSAAQKQGGGSA